MRTGSSFTLPVSGPSSDISRREEETNKDGRRGSNDFVQNRFPDHVVFTSFFYHRPCVNEQTMIVVVRDPNPLQGRSRKGVPVQNPRSPEKVDVTESTSDYVDTRPTSTLSERSQDSVINRWSLSSVEVEEDGSRGVGRCPDRICASHRGVVTLNTCTSGVDLGSFGRRGKRDCLRDPRELRGRHRETRRQFRRVGGLKNPTESGIRSPKGFERLKRYFGKSRLNPFTPTSVYCSDHFFFLKLRSF